MILVLLQEAAAATGQPLIHWSRVALEYAGFLAWFAVFGAVGFRYIVLLPLERHMTSAGTADAGTLRVVHDAGLRGAARIGVIGSLLFLVGLANGLAGDARKMHTTMAAALGNEKTMFYVQLALVLLLIAFFLVALIRGGGVWLLAALAALCLDLRPIVTGRWQSLVNPLHVLAASLWLGTLFVLVAAGLPAILRGDVARERRGAVTAELITRFSPLALAAAALLGITGVTTAWLHLHVLSNLWSTPYGITLILKLCVVVIVVLLGGWNWRRMTPQLGAEGSALAMRRSAKTELVVAAIVLALTAVLVSIPSPRRPGAPPARTTPGLPVTPPPSGG